MKERWPFAAFLRVSLIASSLLLYSIAGAIITLFQARQNEVDLHFLLYSEAEAFSSYLATTGRFDFPELLAVDDDVPSPIWLRVIHADGTIAAQTPGCPVEIVAAPGSFATGKLGRITAKDGQLLPVVRHEVWNQPETYVEALTRADAMSGRRQALLITLGLTGLILIPLSALAAELLTRRLLRPVDRLVGGIRGISAHHLDSRLPVEGRILEITLLAEEFNGLLERIENAVLQMREFTANASHELRTPIASLRAGIDVALRRERTVDEYLLVLRDSLNEIDRIHRVVEALLVLAREPSESLSSNFEPLELGTAIGTAIKALRPLADDKEIEIVWESRTGLLISGHLELIELMMVNLIDNAIRHGPRKSRVEITLSAVSGRAKIRVRDSGPGVEPADRALVFERFFRGRDSRKMGRSGGIGLNVVRWVVSAHGGSISLLDDTPGATFEVELPLLPDPATSEPSRP